MRPYSTPRRAVRVDSPGLSLGSVLIKAGRWRKRCGEWLIFPCHPLISQSHPADAPSHVLVLPTPWQTGPEVGLQAEVPVEQQQIQG
jgi:hypothetical protein